MKYKFRTKNLPSERLCHRRQANSYTPVTKQVGGTWRCRPAFFAYRNTAASVAGDPFDLSKRTATPGNLRNTLPALFEGHAKPYPGWTTCRNGRPEFPDQ